mgnify:CR=1 FL=1
MDEETQRRHLRGVVCLAPLHFELTPMKDTLVSKGNRQKNFDATVQDANEAKK